MSGVEIHRYSIPRVIPIETIGSGWRQSAYAPLFLEAAGKSALNHEVILDDGRNIGPLGSPSESPAIEPSNVRQLRSERPDIAA